MCTTGNFDIAVITTTGNNFFARISWQSGESSAHYRRPMLVQRKYSTVPGYNALHYLIHQFQGAGNNGAACFLE